MHKQIDQSTIQAAMRAAFPQAEERVALFYAMQEYHLGWRDAALQPAAADAGKLIRPRLALLACAAVGGSATTALPLAAGLQLIHDFSLIHDDIEDNSDTRRGRATVWRQWGLAHGINTGDGMFVVAHLALHRLTETGLPAGVVLDVLRRFDETILTICEGQFLDLSFEGNLAISEDDYLAMIRRKTAALLAAATELGAIAGQASAADVQAMFDFGLNLGLAFQVQDDILGIWGDAAETGKPDAADVYQRKLTLPIVHALRSGTSSADLARVYRLDTVQPAHVSQVLAVLDSSGSRGYCEGVADQYHQAALHALEQVQPADSAEAASAYATLHAIAEKLPGRRS